MPELIHLTETQSTNSYLLKMAKTLPSGTVVYTYRQTAGRGQKGNPWESEDGKNLSFSMLLKRPNLAVKRQFFISEAVSLAVAEFLGQYTSGVKIKWPNDIYCNDFKICGILIENSIDSQGIAYSVPGVGININQERFLSNAPNPISLKNITGVTYDLDALLHDVCTRIEERCNFDNATEASLAAMHERYTGSLYRNDGQPHLWELPDGTQFTACIAAVDPDGMLSLRHSSGTTSRYAFKEVKHVINHVTL